LWWLRYFLILASLIGVGWVGHVAVASRNMLSGPPAALLNDAINGCILVPLWAVIALPVLVILNLVYLAYSRPHRSSRMRRLIESWLDAKESELRARANRQ
jgi:hypothetical protein